jgi:hypothetical protein
VAGTQPAVSHEQGQSQGDRGGGRVPGLADVVRNALGIDAEPAANGGDDPRVRLVQDEQVDVVECQAGIGDGTRRRLAEGAHGPLERDVSVHPDPAFVVGGDDRPRGGAVDRQPDPPNPAGGPRPRRSQDDRAGAVSEESGGATVVGIGKP